MIEVKPNQPLSKNPCTPCAGVFFRYNGEETLCFSNTFRNGNFSKVKKSEPFDAWKAAVPANERFLGFVSCELKIL
ncbi:hypothetical protein GLW04_10665 [Halobacillus litoralis]|uniref:Uncharacterized protein n=1 Tax=Halobacillus litoralis TaxID=45668 RepID=A0A845DVL8_9BACI|nr:hypothetical protein [Halobacillus litoralis]